MMAPKAPKILGFCAYEHKKQPLERSDKDSLTIKLLTKRAKIVEIFHCEFVRRWFLEVGVCMKLCMCCGGKV